MEERSWKAGRTHLRLQNTGQKTWTCTSYSVDSKLCKLLWCLNEIMYISSAVYSNGQTIKFQNVRYHSQWLFRCLYKNRKLRTPPSTAPETDCGGGASGLTKLAFTWAGHPLLSTFKIASQSDKSGLCAASKAPRKLCKKNSNQAASHSL